MRHRVGGGAAPEPRLISGWMWLCCAACLSAPEGQVAFTGGTDQEDQCVQVADVSTGQIVRVGPGKRDGAPRWSPDGEWLAFETQNEGGLGIFLVRADGSQGHGWAHKYSWNHGPRWSPDGRRLVYAADAEMGIKQVAVVCDVATGAETVWGGERLGLLRPVWLPNLELMSLLSAGTKLEWKGVDSAALTSESSNGALLVIGITGEEARSSTEIYLTTATQAAPVLSLIGKDSLRYAEWAVEPSPKGPAVAYESNDGGDREIFVLGKRGLLDITNHPAADWNPVWSPDGKWLAFESFRAKRQGVYRVFVDTARVFAVDDGGNYGAWSPAWAPGGDDLAYVSNQSGKPQIQVYDISSEERRPLTQGDTYALAPAWRPRPKP